MLLGIYDLVDYLKLVKEWCNFVLDLMVENNKLIQVQVNVYKKVLLIVEDGYSNFNIYKYLYYFDVVILEVIKDYGLIEKEVMNNGYKIYIIFDQGQ